MATPIRTFVNSPFNVSAECRQSRLNPEHFFCSLSAESMVDLDQIGHSVVFAKGAFLFSQGGSPHGIFILCEGQVRLSTCSDEGKVLMVKVAGAGDVLGLDAVVAGKPYELTAQTSQATRLAFVNHDDFIRFLKGHGDACLQAARHISLDCQRAYGVARSIGVTRSAAWRIAKFLLASAVNGSFAAGVVRSTLPMTHTEIAQVVGTTRETVTRTLADFRKRNIAELKGSALLIRDKPALGRLAEH